MQNHEDQHQQGPALKERIPLFVGPHSDDCTLEVGALEPINAEAGQPFQHPLGLPRRGGFVKGRITDER
jgi:hypothetical protein